MMFSNLPDELKQRPQWVLWKKEVRNGKTTKIPYQASGMKASPTNPNTWTSFEEVCKVYGKGLYSGIGYVFSADDPYTGVDLDECIVNGQLTDEASCIIELLNSYTEYSQSKKGVHVILKAQKPGSRNRKGTCEIYDRERFFVMIGDHLKETPRTIESRQMELNALYDRMFKQEKRAAISLMSDDEILERAQTAKSGGKFSALYNGDIRAYANDRSAADLALCSMLAFWTKDPHQIDQLFRRSGLMRDKWERLDYRERTIQKTLESVTEQYQNKKKSPNQPGQSKHTSIIADPADYALTDLGNSKRFTDKFGHLCFYVYPFKQWYIWSGTHWEKDQNGGMMRLAKKVAEDITHESEGKSEVVIRHAKRSESLAAMKNMIDLAKSELHKCPDQLDQHRWLLNVQNGTIDLKTGELLPHNKQHGLTQMAIVTCDMKATAPLWISFLNRIMEGKADLIRFIQKVVGYSITGSVREQCIFFLYGGGQNGKSTFLEILEKLMGSYSKTLLAKSLMVKKNEGINNDIAELKGIRLVTTSEGEQGQHLAESLVKHLTGGDRRKARFLFGEYFEYDPTDKIWFMTNHKPVIKGNDEGIWRRIFLIPFFVSISPAERDKDLRQKLLKEMPGILNWAIEGCLLYQREGLNPPIEVLAANAAYRAEMDIVSSFVEGCCVMNSGLKVRLKELYTVYREWCHDHDLSPVSNRKMKQQLRERGFDCRNSTGNQVFVFGLDLVSY
jgi:putative DNA primase/helicase